MKVTARNELEVFSARDLRNRSGELLRDAREGRIALITKHGRPAILAIPFDDRLLQYGVQRAMALHLFERGQITLHAAAKVAGVAMEELIELLGELGIPAVSYPVGELEDEIQNVL